jgi:hypothetical protein
MVNARAVKDVLNIIYGTLQSWFPTGGHQETLERLPAFAE